MEAFRGSPGFLPTELTLVGDLTKRQLFAALAMQSLGCPFEWFPDENAQMQVRIRVEYPRLAVEYADALLAALEQQA